MALGHSIPFDEFLRIDLEPNQIRYALPKLMLLLL